MTQAFAIDRITKRPDYVRIAKGRRVARDTLVLQMARQPEGLTSDGPRVGFTCSKKVGNAVARNTTRRRLKEAARDVMSLNAKPGHDYVIIGRGAALEAPYDKLVKDLTKALERIHQPRRPRAPDSRKKDQ